MPPRYLLCVALGLASCDGPGDSNGRTAGSPATNNDASAPDTSADGSVDSASSRDTTTVSPPDTSGGAPSCGDAEECPYWYCECREGPPVNSRHCTNGTCEDAAQACPSSCAAFGTCWLGFADGGFPNGSNAGPSTCSAPDPEPSEGCGDGSDFRDLGANCTGGAHDCESGLCFGGGVHYLCTKRCTTSNECPEGWKCVSPSDKPYDICMQGDTQASGIVSSTNADCAQVTFSDLGGGCDFGNDCQSGVCLGVVPYCSRRCDSAADCPSGWGCTRHGADPYYACDKR